MGPTAKLLGAFALGLVAAALLLHLLDAAPDPGGAAPPAAPSDGAERHEAVDPGAVAELARRVRALESRGGEARSAASTRAADTAMRGGTGTEAVAEPESPEAEEARVERRFAFLSEQVRAEPLDRGWAAEATSTIEQAVAAFPGTTIRRVDCRSTLCELEVEHDDPRTSDRFLDYFFPRVPSLPRGTLRRIETVEGRPRNLVFLARQGHALPRVEEQVEE